MCIIGNAETVAASTAFDAQFPGFPSAWSIWGGDFQGAKPSTAFPHMVLPSLNSTWAQGILGAYQALMSQGPLESSSGNVHDDAAGGRSSMCEYFFMVDDDARYSFTPGSSQVRQRQASIESEILDALRTHRPAVMAFPWAVALNRTASMRTVRDAYTGTETGTGTDADAHTSDRAGPDRVYPLTGFDNGNVLFHHSLMPFMLPFAPHHEDGLHGEWTLPATWLQFFLPRMYQSQALVLATVQYANAMNMDSQAGKPVLRELKRETGLATYEGSRHPYEWPLKKSYEAYLSWGLKRPGQAFGASASIEQLAWTAPQRQVSSSVQASPVAAGLQVLPFDAFLPRINTFFDVLHPTILRRPYVQARHTRADLLAIRRASPIVMRVFVLTMDRAQSLARLMQSLASARFDLVSHPIAWDLHVIVDTPPPAAGPKSRAGHKAVLDYVRTLAWPHGDLTVRVATSNVGLKGSIMGAWEPAAGVDEMAIFLEDDVSVSPLFPVWTETAVRAYHYGQDRPMGTDQLFGVALYAPRWSQVTDQAWSPHADPDQPMHEPYLSQLPCSWGAVYFAGPWRRFLDWYRSPDGGDGGRADPLVPNLAGINRWPHEKSWKKFLIRYMVEVGGAMLYPSLPGNMSFSTNHVEVGTNDKQAASSVMADRYLVPLVPNQGWTPAALQDMLVTPPLEELRVFDVFGVPVQALDRAAATTSVKLQPAVTMPDVWRLPLLPAGSWHAYEKFTIVVPSHRPRWAKLERFIAHYSKSPSVGAIVVVWNDADGGPPAASEVKAMEAKAGPIPLTVRTMAAYDINNRFLPHAAIATDAVFSLDDDVIIDLKDVEFAFYVWQMHPISLVGFRWTTRGYARCPAHTKDKQPADPAGAGQADTAKVGQQNPKATNGSQADPCNGGEYQYLRSIPTDIVARNLKQAHITLTGAAFMHRLYLSMYSGAPMHGDAAANLDTMAPSIMDAVRRVVFTENNCEDIAMNFMVAAATARQPALIVEGRFDTKSMADGDGLWKRPNHYQRRSSCIDKMVGLIGTEGLPVNVKGFPQPWQDEWRDRPRVPPKRSFKVPV